MVPTLLKESVRDRHPCRIHFAECLTPPEQMFFAIDLGATVRFGYRVGLMKAAAR
jgi:hypothetical protein